jgi:hypothetical protein
MSQDGLLDPQQQARAPGRTWAASPTPLSMLPPV